MISWPHFDITGILQSIAAAVLGFVTAVFRQNSRKR